MALTIAITADFGIYKVKLAGSLDTDTVEGFEERVTSQVLTSENLRAVQLHLQDLQYISSLGLGAIARLRKAVTSKGGVIVMVGMQPQVARVFEIVKMLPKEVVFVSHEEADTYLSAIQKKLREEQGP